MESIIVVCAKASFPQKEGIEEKKEDSAREGAKKTPKEINNKREKVKIGLNILLTVLLGVFIKQTKYHEIAFLAQINIRK